MLKEKISEFIGMIRSIEGVALCALISRDGIVAGKFSTAISMNHGWVLFWRLYYSPLSRLEV